MNNALYIAATGMEAQQLELNTISNNLTNINTPAYKTSNVNFQELLYQDPVGARQAIQASGNWAPPGGMPPVGIMPSGMPTAALQGPGIQPSAPLMSPGMAWSGMPGGAYSTPSDGLQAVGITPFGEGVGIASTVKNFTSGSLTQTGSAMDLAIQGNGFLEVTMPDGSYAFTRGGTLSISKDNYLQGPQGYELKPSIRIPVGYTSIAISTTGLVTATTATSSQPVQLGQIEMASFSNPGSLQPQGNGLYMPTDSSGNPVYAKPGDMAMGTLTQGALESSNVDMVTQMVDLVVAQRAYEMNSKVVQTADDLMSLTNHLRG